jgi:CheY-like chemotaxis protein
MRTSLETPAASVHPTARSQSRHLPYKVLLAEDGVDNQRLVTHYLKQCGATVDIAENGLVALQMIETAINKRAPYRLLLSDMQMPEVDGYQLARTIRARGMKLPIIALTAHAMSEDRDRCIDAGCDDYTTKPFDREKLLAICQRLLASSDQHTLYQPTDEFRSEAA